MGAIANGLSMLIAKLAAAVKWIGLLFVAVFTALWDILRDVPAWILDELMQLATTAITAIDVSAFSSLGQWWSGLPSEIMNMLGLLGFGEAMGIIVAAILVRMALQLIPFVRLGS